MAERTGHACGMYLVIVTYCVTAASIGSFSIALQWLILMRLDRLSQPALMSTKLHQRISIPDYIQH